MNRLQHLRDDVWYDRIYKIGVAIKGFDGLVELIAGVMLLVAPQLLHTILQTLSGEAFEHQGMFMAYIAQNVARIDEDLSKSGLLFITLFLISHGVVKLALVYALLKEILWAYPYALIVLVGFLGYQVYALVAHPSISMAVFTLLDAIIIWLVWGEWRKLKHEALDRVASESAV